MFSPTTDRLLTEFDDHLNVVNQRLSAHHQTIRVDQHKIGELEEQLATLNEEMSSARQSLADMKLQNQSNRALFESELINKQSAIDELSDQLSLLQAENRQLETTHEEQVNEFMIRINDFHDEVALHSEERESLNEALLSKQQHLNNVQSLLTVACSTIGDIQSEMKRITEEYLSRCNQQQQTIDQLQPRLVYLQDQVNELTVEQVEADADITAAFNLIHSHHQGQVEQERQQNLSLSQQILQLQNAQTQSLTAHEQQVGELNKLYSDKEAHFIDEISSLSTALSSKASALSSAVELGEKNELHTQKRCVGCRNQ